MGTSEMDEDVRNNRVADMGKERLPIRPVQTEAELDAGAFHIQDQDTSWCQVDSPIGGKRDTCSSDCR
jgi:hypothetical protein